MTDDSALRMCQAMAAAHRAMVDQRTENPHVYEYRATIIHVHDGDTLTAQVDLGFGIFSRHNIRLAHLNAPELSTPEGQASLAWLNDWITQRTTGGAVRIVTQPEKETEKYGRYLATIYSQAGCLNEQMIAAGMAVPYL